MGGKQTRLTPAKSRGKGKAGERPKPKPSQPPEAAELVDRAKIQLEEELSLLQEVSGTIKRALGSEETTPALLRETAAVARAVVGVSAEIRRVEKHEREIVGAMSPEQRDALVFEYVRQMPMARRADLRRLLDEIDGAGGGKALLA